MTTITDWNIHVRMRYTYIYIYIAQRWRERLDGQGSSCCLTVLLLITITRCVPVFVGFRRLVCGGGPLANQIPDATNFIETFNCLIPVLDSYLESVFVPNIMINYTLLLLPLPLPLLLLLQMVSSRPSILKSFNRFTRLIIQPFSLTSFLL